MAERMLACLGKLASVDGLVWNLHVRSRVEIPNQSIQIDPTTARQLHDNSKGDSEGDSGVRLCGLRDGRGDGERRADREERDHRACLFRTCECPK